MRNATTGTEDVKKRGNNLLPPTSDEEATMSSESRWNDSIDKNISEPLSNSSKPDVPQTPTRSSRRGRRRPSIVPVVPLREASLSPKTATKGVRQHYSQQSAFRGPKPTPNENRHYSQQLAFNNSQTSMDWASNHSQSSLKPEGSLKHYSNYNESLVFDDDLSLSLHQTFTDDDDDDSSVGKSPLSESGYQLSTVGTFQGSLLERSLSTHQTPITSVAEVSSTSSHFTAKEKRRDEVYGSKTQIWGREKELSSLQSRFLSTASESNGQKYGGSSNLVEIAPRHVWVSGVSGIGKTSLVDAFLSHNNLSVMQPIICRGAFEENWMDASKAFPAIMSCFADLFQHFLDGDERDEWSERVRACLEDEIDVTLLVSLIPSLGIMLDVDSDDTKYSFEKKDKDLFERLSRALGRILSLVCDYSIVIFFLDDVQWAGDDSLQLLKALLSKNDAMGFFFVGTHRSGIKVSHSLHKIKSELHELFGGDIKVGGIGIKSARSLVRSHLRLLDRKALIDPRMLDSVVNSWYKHSSSRIPMFLKHLVHRLYEKDAFKVNNGGWMLDSPKILPSSSLSLVVERIEDLPEECDLILKSAALLDTNNFNTNMLMVAVAANTRSETLEIDVDSVKEVLSTLTEKMLIEEHSPGNFTFAHNVVKAAASARFSVSTKRRRSAIHWRMATDLKRLKDEASLNSKANAGFESLLIANHFSKGLLSIDDKKKIEMVVKLYLQLAATAMKRSAFVTATNILETAIAALDKKSRWEESYNLTLRTHLALARSLYCSDDVDKAKPILNAIIANGRTPRDKLDAFDLLITIYRAKKQYEQAKEFASKALNDIFEDDIINANVEEKFSKIRELAQKKSDADLLVLPDLEHKKTTKKMPFLLQLAEVSGLCRDYKSQDLAALRMVELTLKYGSCEGNFTGLVFAYFGLCVARRHLHGEAYRYGRLAEMMSEKDNPLGRQAIAFHNYDMRHWRNHVRGGRKILKEISKASMEENEVENIAFQVGAYLSAILYTGTPLSSEDSVIALYDQKRKQFELPGNWNVIAPYNTLVKLKGENSKLMKRKYFAEKAFQYDFFFQMVESVFMYDMERAEKLNGKIFMKPRGCWGSYRLFMEGLIATYNSRVLVGKNKLMYQKKATKFAEILTTWTKAGMKNSAHMANILSVELKLASDKGVSTKRLSILFDTAISSAYQDGFPHHAALASERAGIYFLDIKDEILASKYLSRASILYAEWGAVAKVNQLESVYGQYLNTDPAQIRSLKKTSSIPSGSLMFTDRKSDKGSQRNGRRTGYRSRSQDVARSHIGSRRSASLDTRGKIPSNPVDQITQSAHVRGRPVLSKGVKEANGRRSQSVTQRRPSLVRVGSLSSITSLLSNISDPNNDSRRGTKKNKVKEENGKFQKFKRRNSTSSISTMDVIDTKRNPSGYKGLVGEGSTAASTTAKEDKGKFKKFRRRNSTSSIPTMEPQDMKSSGGRERKNRRVEGQDVTLTPPQPKKKEWSGPMPSPGPRKTKLVLADDDASYLLHYDTDDFDTDEFDSVASSTPDKDFDELEGVTKWKKGRKKMEENYEKEKSTKKTKKKKNDLANEEFIDLQKTPKRKTKAKVGLRSKTLTL